MATASGALSEATEKNLPPLSPNIEASQLLTPLQLARITIDNPQWVSIAGKWQTDKQSVAVSVAPVYMNQELSQRLAAY